MIGGDDAQIWGLKAGDEFHGTSVPERCVLRVSPE
jgi:hypothetical protein